MKQLKKIFSWVIILFSILVGSLLLCIYLFETDIKKAAITEINNQLAVKMQADPDYSISLWNSFPNLSLEFSNVSIEESTEITNQPFIKAKEVFLVFNIIDIIKKHYSISKIKIHDGEVNIAEKGENVNYLIFKEDSNNNESSDIYLDKVILSDIGFNYKNDKNRSDIALIIDQVVIKGNFNENSNNLIFSGEGYSKSISIEENQFLKDKNFIIESNFTFTSNELLFKESTLEVNDFALNLEGSIKLNEDNNFYNLKFDTKESSFNSLFSLLPDEYINDIKKFNAKGKLELHGSLKGVSSNTINPRADIAFQLKNGTIYEKNTKRTIKDIAFKGSFTNGDKQSKESSDLKILGFKCNLDEEIIKGSFRINNFKNPYINMEARGSTTLENWNGFIQKQGILLKGKTKFDISFKGNIRDLSSGMKAAQDSKGWIELNKVGYISKHSPYHFDKVFGHLEFNGKDLTFNSLKGIINTNAFNAKGKIANLIGTLMDKSHAVLINAVIHSPNIDLNKILVSNSNTEENKSIKIPNHIKLNATITIDKLKYNRIDLQQIHTKLNLHNGSLHIPKFTSKFLNGNLSFSANLKNYATNMAMGTMHFEGENLNAKKLFYEFEDFGQNTLTHKNLDGNINATADLGVMLNPDWSIDKNMLYAHIETDIMDGRLVNFKPLESMSSYVSIEELKDIKFSQLSNTIEVQKGVITLPNMRIINSALNLQIGGTHTFENYMNYNVEVKLADVLQKKYGSLLKSKNQSENGTKIFMRIKGTPDNLQITVDKAKVKEVINQTFKTETKSIGELFKKDVLKKEHLSDSAKKEKIIKKEIEDTEWEE